MRYRIDVIAQPASRLGPSEDGLALYSLRLTDAVAKRNHQLFFLAPADLLAPPVSKTSLLRAAGWVAQAVLAEHRRLQTLSSSRAATLMMEVFTSPQAPTFCLDTATGGMLLPATWPAGTLASLAAPAAAERAALRLDARLPDSPSLPKARPERPRV